MDNTTETAAAAGLARCYGREISVTYSEVQWSPACEKTTTEIRISGLPLIHSHAKDGLELLASPDPYGSIKRSLSRIRELFVPPGQEVRLESFENLKLEPNNWMQCLVFVTICDHGD